MKIHYIILLSLSLISSCSNKKNDYLEMEIMSYRPYYYLTDDSINKLEIRCYFYASVDKLGEAILITNPENELKYLAGKIEKTIIDKVLISIDTIKGNIHLAQMNRPQLYLYDGPEVKLTITYSNNIRKSINFHEGYNNKESAPFQELYNILENSILDTCHLTSSEEKEIWKKLDSYKRYSLNIDTTVFKIPFPPKIYTGPPIKYVLPVETK